MTNEFCLQHQTFASTLVGPQIKTLPRSRTLALQIIGPAPGAERKSRNSFTPSCLRVVRALPQANQISQNRIAHATGSVRNGRHTPTTLHVSYQATLAGVLNGSSRARLIHALGLRFHRITLSPGISALAQFP